MFELLKQAFQRIRALPPETQDDLARVPLRLAGNDEAVYQLAPEEVADLTEADAEIERASLHRTSMSWPCGPSMAYEASLL